MLLQTLKEALAACQVELEEAQDKVKELESSIEDKQEAVRIVERKSQGMVSGVVTLYTNCNLVIFHSFNALKNKFKLMDM